MTLTYIMTTNSGLYLSAWPWPTSWPWPCCGAAALNLLRRSSSRVTMELTGRSLTPPGGRVKVVLHTGHDMDLWPDCWARYVLRHAAQNVWMEHGKMRGSVSTSRQMGHSMSSRSTSCNNAAWPSPLSTYTHTDIVQHSTSATRQLDHHRYQPTYTHRHSTT